jgi:phage protein D
MTRPGARISANGKEITSLLLGSGGQKAILVSLSITDEAGVKSDKLEMVIDNRDPFAVPPIGSEIEVALGYEPAPAKMGRYRLDSWSKNGPPTVLTLSASAVELTTNFKEKRLRSYHEKTLGEIAREIAGRHGLKAAVDANLAAQHIAHIDQQAESDMGFLTRLAARYGATFKVGDGRLIIAAQGSAAAPAGGSKGVIVVRPVDVSTWSVTQAERGGHKSAVAYWHDHQAGKRIAATAGHGSPRHVDRHVYPTKAEAEAAAKAALGRLTRGRRSGEISGAGNPAIYAEAQIRLEGLDPECDGTFFAKSVRHEFSAGGYTTSVSLESERGGDSD